MKNIIISLLLISLFSCQNNDNIEKVIHPLDQVKIDQEKSTKQGINIFQLSWIEGIWLDSTTFPNKTTIENWQVLGDTIFGKRGSIKGNDTTYAQVSKIFINNDQPVYLLEQEGSAFVIFKLKDFNNTMASFGNIANNSPTGIVYSKKGQNLSLKVLYNTPAGERTLKNNFSALKR